MYTSSNWLDKVNGFPNYYINLHFKNCSISVIIPDNLKLFKFGIQVGMKWKPTAVLIYISLLKSLRIFSYAFWPFGFPSVKCLHFCPLRIAPFMFFFLMHRIYLCILNTNSLAVIFVENLFPPLCGLYFLWDSFWWVDILNLNVV